MKEKRSSNFCQKFRDEFCFIHPGAVRNLFSVNQYFAVIYNWYK